MRVARRFKAARGGERKREGGREREIMAYCTTSLAGLAALPAAGARPPIYSLAGFHSKVFAA